VQLRRLAISDRIHNFYYHFTDCFFAQVQVILRERVALYRVQLGGEAFFPAGVLPRRFCDNSGASQSLLEIHNFYYHFTDCFTELQVILELAWPCTVAVEGRGSLLQRACCRALLRAQLGRLSCREGVMLVVVAQRYGESPEARSALVWSTGTVPSVLSLLVPLKVSRQTTVPTKMKSPEALKCR
jgi:hypothetical protein